MKKVYLSPAGILILMVVSIFAIETFVMGLLFFLPHESPVTHALLDSTLLILFLSPFLYFFLFRPLLMRVKERRRAEEGLTRERDKARRYFDVAGVIMVVIDADDRVSLINRKGCEILGYGESEVVGKDWFANFVPEGAREEARAGFRDLRKNGAGTASYVEGSVVTKNGAERIIRWHNTPLVEDGRAAGILSSGEDITERKRIRKALKESETRYRLVHNTSFDGIIISDSEDSIIDCNPAAEKIFGYGPGELKGMDITLLMPGKYREDHINGLKGFLSTGQSKVQGRVLELEGLKKNGEVFPIELVLSSFSIEGAVHFTGTIRDITERRRAEKERELIRAQLNQAQKMEAVGRLASGIAHDFNNILTAVRGNAELLMEDLDRKDPVYSRLDEIIQSVVHASKLTRQLLLFGRIHPLEAVELDINSVINEMIVMLKRLLGEDIEVATELKEGLWRVTADEGNIEQVVLNLSVNARDAMPEGGRLLIKTENIELGEESCKGIPESRPGRFVLLTVSDTGVGMDKEILNRIFEPFFSTKEKEKGIGIGLSVIYGIVKKHGGSITVESGPGRGTAFRVYLPVSTAEAWEGKSPGPDEKMHAL